jgi:hypothetical protein
MIARMATVHVLVAGILGRVLSDAHEEPGCSITWWMLVLSAKFHQRWPTADLFALKVDPLALRSTCVGVVSIV